MNSPQKNNKKNILFGVNVDNLPPVLSRREAAKLTGGAYAASTLANLDSFGRGPGGDVLFVGKTRVYRTPDFLAWLESQIRRG
jgi:hypothetical protein